MTGPRPLRGAALARARNTKTSVAPEVPAPPVPDQQAGAADLPGLLCHRDVTIRPDYTEIAVAVYLPSHIASRLAALLPDPDVRDALAAASHTIAREEDCAEMDRRDLARTERYL